MEFGAAVVFDQRAGEAAHIRRHANALRPDHVQSARPRYGPDEILPISQRLQIGVADNFQIVHMVGIVTASGKLQRTAVERHVRAGGAEGSHVVCPQRAFVKNSAAAVGVVGGEGKRAASQLGQRTGSTDDVVHGNRVGAVDDQLAMVDDVSRPHDAVRAAVADLQGSCVDGDVARVARPVAGHDDGAAALLGQVVAAFQLGASHGEGGAGVDVPRLRSSHDNTLNNEVAEGGRHVEPAGEQLDVIGGRCVVDVDRRAGIARDSQAQVRERCAGSEVTALLVRVVEHNRIHVCWQHAAHPRALLVHARRVIRLDNVGGPDARSAQNQEREQASGGNSECPSCVGTTIHETS